VTKYRPKLIEVALPLAATKASASPPAAPSQRTPAASAPDPPSSN